MAIAETVLEVQDLAGVAERVVDLVTPEVAPEPVQGQQREQHDDLDEQAAAVAAAPPPTEGTDLRVASR